MPNHALKCRMKYIRTHSTLCTSNCDTMRFQRPWKKKGRMRITHMHTQQFYWWCQPAWFVGQRRRPTQQNADATIATFISKYIIHARLMPQAARRPSKVPPEGGIAKRIPWALSQWPGMYPAGFVSVHTYTTAKTCHYKQKTNPLNFFRNICAWFWRTRAA